MKRYYNSSMLRADRIIANSRYTGETITRRHPELAELVRIIPRGADLDVFDPVAISDERVSVLAAAWGLNGENWGFRVLLPGRLTSWKGHELAVEAVAKMKTWRASGNDQGLTLVFCGGAQGRDDYETALRALIEERGVRDMVHLVGDCADMPAAYAWADLVIAPSTRPEAFGRVAVEAGAMRTPVIAANHGGAMETIVDGAMSVYSATAMCEATLGVYDDLLAALVKQLKTAKFEKVYDLAADEAGKKLYNAMGVFRPKWYSAAPAAKKSGKKAGSFSLPDVDKVMAAAGLGAPERLPDMRWALTSRKDSANMKPSWYGISTPFGVMMPGLNPEKRWPASCYAGFATIMARSGFMPVLAGPRDLHHLGDEIAHEAPQLVDLTGKTDHLQLAALSQEAAFFVSDDAEEMHLAVSIGCEGVVIADSKSAPVTPEGRHVVTLTSPDGHGGVEPLFAWRTLSNMGLILSEEERLDLVEVSPNTQPPVCKILDYGKYKYQQQKKKAEAKKKQKVVEIKEIKMRPNIDDHDYEVKVKAMKRFFEEGDKVKVTLRFRGREMAHQDRGADLLRRVQDDFEEIAKVEQFPKMEGRQIMMVMGRNIIMDEGWLTQIVANRWLLAIVAYVFGAATFWVLSFTDRLPAFFQKTLVSRAVDQPERDADSDEKLEALAAEIEKAKSLLQENDTEATTVRDRLSALDEAVKRANGRLKLVSKSIKR
ncbi:Translation initiation factor IF-3 [Durusdinium trenchii]|uniref:Translation initiation factor IF-3 n=1 Tax=Durusdinium trenchii TaxID=1381693 RepID=A0ABP0LS67_9DINO